MTAAPEGTTTIDVAAKISTETAASGVAAAVMWLIERPHRPGVCAWCCRRRTSFTLRSPGIGQPSRNERRAHPALQRLGRSGI
jgi:hypothetical protein